MGVKDKVKQNKFLMKMYDRMLPYYCIVFTKSAIKMLYKQTYQKPLDLDNPRDLNEKINWLKLYYYNKDPLVAKCADKWAVREYVEELGFKDILNEVYFVFDSVDEIDWDLLPDKFALKFNKFGGMNIICADKAKLDKEEAVKKMKGWFHAEYGERYGELQYRKAKPKIICEKYLGDKDNFWPIDYKVHCFNGKALFTMVCTDRDTEVKFMFVDNDYSQLDMNTEVHFGGILPPRPKNFERMLQIAEVLSEPFPMLRVDFYEVDEKLYLGEMTFTSQGGYIDFINQEWLDKLGDILVLPEKMKGRKKT